MLSQVGSLVPCYARLAPHRQLETNQFPSSSNLRSASLGSGPHALVACRPARALHSLVTNLPRKIDPPSGKADQSKLPNSLRFV
jgi:hypothetical protein